MECVLPGESTGTDGTGTDSSGGAGGTSTGGSEASTGGTSSGSTGGGLCDEFIDNPPEFVDDFNFNVVISVGEVFEQDGQCCFDVTWEEGCVGRPFIVDAVPRTAGCVRREDWLARAELSAGELDAATRGRVAAAWAEDARVEHASIASFARFVLQLLALGAPAELVAAAQSAASDELEHARLCFGLAAAYGGAPVGPGPLAIDGALTGAEDLGVAVLAAFREGCVGETLAALEAAVARDGAREPAARAALTRIAEDELRHAALAWRFVAWGLERGGPALHDALAAAVGALAVEASHVAPRSPSEPDLRAHGRLGAGQRIAERRRGVLDVVLPAARALLAGHARAAAA